MPGEGVAGVVDGKGCLTAISLRSTETAHVAVCTTEGGAVQGCRGAGLCLIATSVPPLNQTAFATLVSQLPPAGLVPPLLSGSQINWALPMR